MCMACDLLTGLAPAALIPDEVLRREPVLYPDGLGTAVVSQLFPRDASPLVGRARRYAPRGVDIHGESAGWHSWRDAVLAAGAAPPPAWLPSLAAIEAFRHFWATQLDGAIGHDLRFVLAWPTPYTLLAAAEPAVPPEEVEAALSRLESAFIAEFTMLLSSLPADQLTLQWSASGELRLWETRGRNIASRSSLPQRVLQGFWTLAQALPANLELGFHYCRRDAFSADAAAVADLGQVSRLIGATLSALDRPLGYVHVNVPMRLADLGAFESLLNLVHWPDLEVHLGLARDGGQFEAIAAQLTLARQVLPYAAPSPPCGVDPAQVSTLLEQLPRVGDSATAP